MPKPLIGITAYTRHWPTTGWRYDVCYGENATAIEQAGGLPVLIPSQTSADNLRQLYERLDGVLLPGGGDINPAQYGTQPDATLYSVDDSRDRVELAMARWAVADDVPVFGICRGIQVMNVALGGTLVQDIPSQVETSLRHSIAVPGDEARSTLLHDVQIEQGSRLAQIMGSTTVTVNSIHHQTIGEVAPALAITARAPDGLIEGVEMPDKHFVLAVQWHPEDLVATDERMQNLFKAFVEAARARMRG